MKHTNTIVDRLLNSEEPSVRYKTLAHALDYQLDSADIKQLQQEIKASPRVRQLLSEQDSTGEIPHHPYAKWDGAHWVLACLADIGYPRGDESLIPLREQVFSWLFGARHQKSIRTINGRVRRCASQEGNTLFYLLALGLADGRADELARRLAEWQWPDGGWNCDKNPDAVHSSFHESLIPLRGLALHARVTGNEESGRAAERAAEVFLKRRLYKRQSDGSIIHENFTRLHYPPYWHFDILFGLKVLAEAGFLDDPRCRDALDLLESKRLSDGGWPAEKKYYQVTNRRVSGRTLVGWGGTSKRRLNEWITADVLYVLRAAGWPSLPQVQAMEATS